MSVKQNEMILSYQKTILVISFILTLCVLFWVALTRNTAAVDWNITYYPATQALIDLKSPYQEAPLFLLQYGL